MPDSLFDPDETDPLSRPCLQCQAHVIFDGQPGWATCAACGVRQYLTEPSAAWPTGGLGRDWDGGVPGRPGSTLIDHDESTPLRCVTHLHRSAPQSERPLIPLSGVTERRL